MKKKNERASKMKRVSRPVPRVTAVDGESLADRLELMVDQILDGASAHQQESDFRKPVLPINLRPAGHTMTEDEINSLMERMILSDTAFNGYTH